MSPQDCRRLLDAPDIETPQGIRDRALLAVLAYTGCRVGELTRLRVMDYKDAGGHKVLEVRGKGGKERRVPLHPEAFERLETWIATAGMRDGGDLGTVGRKHHPQACERACVIFFLAVEWKLDIHSIDECLQGRRRSVSPVHQSPIARSGT